MLCPLYVVYFVLVYYVCLPYVSVLSMTSNVVCKIEESRMRCLAFLSHQFILKEEKWQNQIVVPME